jgi:uncharacterized protein (DUF924 family)
VVEAGQLTPDEIDKYAVDSEGAVAVILLLDQIPRNIFRDAEAAKVRL